MSRISFYQWAWILAFVSFLLRLSGFYVDLPPYDFCDEQIYTSGIYGLTMAHWGWNPPGFLAGGINYYLPAFIFSFLHFFNVHLTNYRIVLLSRFIGPGILSCCAIPIVFLIGQHLFQDNKKALLSASILTFSTLMLSISRIWYPDHYDVIFSSLSLYAATRIVMDKNSIIRYYILLGFTIGLMASTKYNGFFFIALIPIAHLLAVLKRQNRKNLIRELCFRKEVWVALFAVVIAFLVTNPYFISSWPKYLAAIELTRAVYLQGSPGLMVANTPIFYTKLLIFTTFGILGGFFILFGSIVLILRNKIVATLLLAMPIIFIFLMGRYKNAFDRNISVLVPYSALILSIGLSYFLEKLKFRIFKIFLILMLLIEPVTRIIMNIYHDFLPDSRKLAAAWIDQNTPPESLIGGRGVYNGTLGIPVNKKKFRYVELPFPTDTTLCVDYYYMDKWMDQLYGKPSSIFASPYYSENIFRNTGGYYFKNEHNTTERWLSQYTEIHEIKGSYYGPDIFIYKRKIPCRAIKL